MISNLLEAQAGLELSIFLLHTLERLGFIGSYYNTLLWSHPLRGETIRHWFLN